MAISIPSDLVLDVARAADPTRVAKASADLNAGAPVADLSLGKAGGAATARTFSSFLPQTYSMQQTSAARQPISPEKKAANELETLLLQQMLESILPKEDGAVFGKGTAGSVWRSMMAEQVARQLSSSGEIHLSKILTPKSG
jgi:flagellar protein FlgJ